MVHIRTDKEIQLIASSCQIVADTLDMLTDHVKPGAKITDLDRLAEEFIISKGARPAFKGYMGFPATLCVSCLLYTSPSPRDVEESRFAGWA